MSLVVQGTVDELLELVREIKDPRLKELVEGFVRKAVELSEREGIPIDESPAGISRHHAYPKGLVQHTIATAKIARALCEVVEEVYGGVVDRDTVLAAAIAHDLMKAPTYSVNAQGGYTGSELGLLIDHLSLALVEMKNMRFPKEVIHAVLAHHGEASPTPPRTVEAIIVHVADLADSSLNRRLLENARFTIRNCVGEEEISLDAKHAIELIKAREAGGCEEVAKLLGREGAENSSR